MSETKAKKKKSDSFKYEGILPVPISKQNGTDKKVKGNYHSDRSGYNLLKTEDGETGSETEKSGKQIYTVKGKEKHYDPFDQNYIYGGEPNSKYTNQKVKGKSYNDESFNENGKPNYKPGDNKISAVIEDMKARMKEFPYEASKDRVAYPEEVKKEKKTDSVDINYRTDLEDEVLDILYANRKATKEGHYRVTEATAKELMEISKYKKEYRSYAREAQKNISKALATYAEDLVKKMDTLAKKGDFQSINNIRADGLADIIDNSDKTFAYFGKDIDKHTKKAAEEALKNLEKDSKYFSHNGSYGGKKLLEVAEAPAKYLSRTGVNPKGQLEKIVEPVRLVYDNEYRRPEFSKLYIN